jgi:hypothetical protein
MDGSPRVTIEMVGKGYRVVDEIEADGNSGNNPPELSARDERFGGVGRIAMEGRGMPDRHAY